jgi:bifunctional non-homologous end joining protein LigD
VSERLKVGRRTIELTHPDKVLFPRAKVTKHDLARHYERVAPVMLPYLSGRPLALQAFPGGIEGYGYFMKAVPDYFPEWVKRATVAKRGGTVTHVLAEDAATLVYLAGQNVVTLHSWLSRAERPRQPDRLILDFDPSGGGFADVRAAAREAGERLRDRGLVPYAMATGSRGIHVICPLRRRASFKEVHRFSRAIAEEMVADNPRRLTLEWRKADRGDKIYVDVNRNNYAQHAVTPYAVRSRPKAPVAVPLHWEELWDRTLRPDRWTVASVGERIDAEGDPWKGMGRRARALPSSVPLVDQRRRRVAKR